MERTMLKPHIWSNHGSKVNYIYHTLYFNGPKPARLGQIPNLRNIRPTSLLGCLRWNWKPREKNFLNQNPEVLLRSSYSFWPWLSNSGSGWDLASTQPWKKCEKLFLYFSQRNFQFLTVGILTRPSNSAQYQLVIYFFQIHSWIFLHKCSILNRGTNTG